METALTLGVEVAAVEVAGWIAERYDITHRLGHWAARGVVPALEGVTAEVATWRPAPDQHTIAAIVDKMCAARVKHPVFGSGCSKSNSPSPTEIAHLV